ncbi:MAG TPA: choice-of-anchor Q domain-containing protein [bacterium]|nr:choice-of-anchor Q domain-containing protein [bacterium]HQO35790.1 choice-of-anchor Q domain-containing protein [bacterium]HQQ00775.1 choice-of-anchor Q domain-containing protein [bacterium]
MKRVSIAVITVFALVMVVSSAWAISVEVNKSGTYKTIQAGIDKCQEANDGADIVTITDSATYEEAFWIGNPDVNISPVTLTSNKTGDARPIISPLTAYGPLVETNSTARMAGTAVTSNGSVLSNLIIESNPDTGSGNGASTIHVEANDVVIENCLIRPRAGTAGCTKFPNSALFLSQYGAGGIPGDERRCNGVIIRNCDFWGVATDGQPEPTNAVPGGWLIEYENGQFATFIRCDAFANGQENNIEVLIDNCSFRYSYDAGLFPSSRGDATGRIKWTVRDCYFDAFGKFAVRSRGADLIVERCVFSRTNNGPHGDGENSAVAAQTQGQNNPYTEVSNCLFVNCGGVHAKKGYYGGINNHNAIEIKANHCTFDLCTSGVTVGAGNGELIISNSIFNRIGYNRAPAVWYDGLPPENNDPFITWDSINFNPMVTAVFNDYAVGGALITVNNCLVGQVADEQTDWATADPANPAGTFFAYGNVEGLDTVTRGDPAFANDDFFGANPYQLTAGSPAIDKGVAAEPAIGTLDVDGTPRVVGAAADLGCQELPGASVRDWSIF